MMGRGPTVEKHYSRSTLNSSLNLVLGELVIEGKISLIVQSELYASKSCTVCKVSLEKYEFFLIKAE